MSCGLVSALGTLYEYNDSTNNVWGLDGTGKRDAQAFTIGTVGTNVDFLVTNVSLYCYRTGTPGTVTVGIYTVNGTGMPTGSALCSGTRNGDSFDTSAAWYVFNMTSSYELNASTKYAIVVSASGVSGASDKLNFRISTANPYAGGTFCYSDDGGLTWMNSVSVNYDMGFRVYGKLAIDFGVSLQTFNGFEGEMWINTTVYQGYADHWILQQRFSDDNSSWSDVVEYAMDPSPYNSSELFDFSLFPLGYFEFRIRAYDNDSDIFYSDFFYIHRFLSPPHPLGGGGWDLVSLPYDGTMLLTNTTLRVRDGSHNYSWAEAVAAGVVMNMLFGWDIDAGQYTIATGFEGGHGYWMYFFDSDYSLWVPSNLSGSSSYTVNISLVNLSATSFKGWSGSITNSSMNVSILVTSDMVIQGNFSDVGGSYPFGSSGYRGSVMLTLGLVGGTSAGGFVLSRIWRRKQV